MKIKDKILTSLLPSFAFAFTFILFGPLEIYVGNIEELGFDIKDIFVYLLICFFVTFIVLSLILLVLPGKAHMVGYWIMFAISVFGYIQGNFLNSGIQSLIGDDVGSPIKNSTIILNAIIWAIFIGVVVVAAILNKKTKWIRIGSLFLVVLIIGMQLAGSVQIAIEYSNYAEHKNNIEKIFNNGLTPGSEEYLDEIDQGNYVMTTKGLYNVSKEKNVVVFVIDRFDISYYEDIIEDNESFFEKFNDFTLYTDNISTYSRTYPGITSMLTGVDFSGELEAEQYFRYAYRNSDFLHDLVENDYRVKIYTQDYYAYRSPNALAGVAYNMERTEKQGEIKDKVGLTEAILSLSLYRYLPIVFKNFVKISSGTFSGFITFEDTEPLFDSDDNIAFYNGLKEDGLSFDDSTNSFSFIHVIGVHDPCEMDEYGNYKEKASSTETAKGCMNMVYDYVQEMKKLGVYDDSLIIVTGDHPRARDDFEYPSQPRITSLFVKYPKASHDGLKISTAQVSQDMLIPTIVKEMGLKTTNEYGQTYRDMENYEGEVVRRHIFELYYNDAYLIEYHITGNGRDFKNWVIYDEKSIGRLYK